MGLRLLIAEPRAVYRKGLYTIFSHDSSVQSIHEATTVAEFQTKLCPRLIDFVIVNQTFITDMSLLPKDHFVIITDKPDRAIFDAAISYGLRGYLLESSLETLIRLVLYLPPGQCLLDPALTLWVIKTAHDDTFSEPQYYMLTPREQEILALRRAGQSYQHIAVSLCISKETVKKHLQHIAHKLNMKPDQR